MCYQPLKWCSILLLCVALSACGFYLRGHAPVDDLTIAQFSLETPNNRPVAEQIYRTAINRKITLNVAADWALAVENVEVNQWRASTSQDYSQNQYWLSVSVELIIRYKTTTYQPIVLRQESLFQDNVDALNSKSYEKQQILQEIYQKLADQALLKLAYLMKKPPDCNCTQDHEAQ